MQTLSLGLPAATNRCNQRLFPVSSERDTSFVYEVGLLEAADLFHVAANTDVRPPRKRGRRAEAHCQATRLEFHDPDVELKIRLRSSFGVNWIVIVSKRSIFCNIWTIL